MRGVGIRSSFCLRGSDITDIAGAAELASAGPLQHDADLARH
jgi:hypothetical protein